MKGNGNLSELLHNFFAALTTVEGIWLVIGFSAQALFSARFLVQWIASEQSRRSIVPEAFWYLSFAGGALLFAYAVYRKDPVFMLGQGFGLLVYSRNIFFLRAAKRQDNSDVE